jgi:hypothetical protein
MTQNNLPLPTIRLEQEAADFVRSHGGHVMVRRSPRHGCCGGRVYLPVVNLGQPTQIDEYIAIQHDDIIIHLDRVLLAQQHSPVVIGLSRWWGWHELWVEEN